MIAATPGWTIFGQAEDALRGSCSYPVEPYLLPSSTRFPSNSTILPAASHPALAALVLGSGPSRVTPPRTLGDYVVTSFQIFLPGRETSQLVDFRDTSMAVAGEMAGLGCGAGQTESKESSTSKSKRRSSAEMISSEITTTLDLLARFGAE